jgi:hypothetical protein
MKNPMGPNVLAALLAILPCAFAQAEELLRDKGFQQGYAVMSPQKDIYTTRTEQETVHTLDVPDATSPPHPVWRLVQWGSDKSIANVKSQSTEDNGKRWESRDLYNGLVTVYKAVALTERHG